MLVNVVDDNVNYPFMHIVASVLAWASAVINPFIYAFKNRQYQQAFTKVIKCQPQRQPTVLSNSKPLGGKLAIAGAAAAGSSSNASAAAAAATAASNKMHDLLRIKKREKSCTTAATTLAAGSAEGGGQMAAAG